MKIRKVLLINPPQIIRRGLSASLKRAVLPLGLAYIAAVLREKYEVQVLDALITRFPEELEYTRDFIYLGMPQAEIAAAIQTINPDAVGIAANVTPQHEAFILTARTIKQVNPDLPVIAGGQHATLFAEKLLREYDCLDYIILGEGENTVLRLLDHLNRAADVSGLDGFACRHHGRVTVNPQTEFIADLDTLPFPARELFPLELYFARGTPQNSFARSNRYASLITSRGCPQRCSFCTTHKHWGGKYRMRSAASVVAEIEQLVARHGIEELQFCDDNLTADAAHARDLFTAMNNRTGSIPWCVPSGIAPGTVNAELLRLMRDSGCYEIPFALESGSQAVLDNIIHKPVDVQGSVAIIRQAKALGLYVHLYLIIGFPGETMAQIGETFTFCLDHADIIDNPHIGVATPLPGSALFDLCVAQGIINTDNLDFKNFEFFNGVISTREFSAARLTRLIKIQTMKFHLRKIIRDPRCLYGNYLAKMIRYPGKFLKILISFSAGQNE